MSIPCTLHSRICMFVNEQNRQAAAAVGPLAPSRMQQCDAFGMFVSVYWEFARAILPVSLDSWHGKCNIHIVVFHAVRWHGTNVSRTYMYIQRCNMVGVSRRCPGGGWANIEVKRHNHVAFAHYTLWMVLVLGGGGGLGAVWFVWNAAFARIHRISD